MLPVGSVQEADVPPPAPRPESPAGCFSCGNLTHETEQCPVLDESFPFRGGGRTELMTNSYYDWAQGGLLPIRRERSTDPGRGVGHPDQ